MNKTSLLAAALLAAAPALAQAATMQAVFTGVGSDKAVYYSGYRDDGVEVRNETVSDESFVGTPGTITVVYDTALAELVSSVSDYPESLRYEYLSLQNAMTSIEVKSGDDVVFSLASPGGFSTEALGTHIYGYRWTSPNPSNHAEDFVSQFTQAIYEEDNGKVPRYNRYDVLASFSLASLFSAFDFETPFSVASLGEDHAGWMSFHHDDQTAFYDGDTNLGYERAYTTYTWRTNSLTVTRLDDTPQPAPVPLPAGAPLVLTGLAGLFGVRRLKRRA